MLHLMEISIDINMLYSIWELYVKDDIVQCVAGRVLFCDVGKENGKVYMQRK